MPPESDQADLPPEPKRAGTEMDPLTQKQIWTPLRYIHNILEGKGDGGTAWGKSQLLKGVQNPTGMAAASDKHADQPIDKPFPTNSALTSLSKVTFDGDPQR